VVYRHHTLLHLYADDTVRLMMSHSPKDRLMNCVNNVLQWCALRQLQLDTDKMVWFGWKANLNKL